MNDPRRNRPRALVVDDDRAWQDILREILEDAGFAIDTAGTLADGVRLAAGGSHQMAVVDLSLQGENPHNQDGLVVLKAIREHDPACTAVLLTGYATVELAVSAIKQYGAYTCLQKETFQRRAFQEIVQQALSSGEVFASHDHGESTPTEETAWGKDVPAERLAGEFTETALVVEDDEGWRGILDELLADAGYKTRLCGSFGEAVGMLRREKFNLAVLDLSLQGSVSRGEASGQELEGYRILENIHAKGIPAVVVSGITDPAEIERAYREMGIFAFLEKRAFTRATFMQTIRDARSTSETPTETELLTDREREILCFLLKGETNQEIADRMYISVNTVKRHLKAIFRKLDVHTRSAAVAVAAKLALGQDE